MRKANISISSEFVITVICEHVIETCQENIRLPTLQNDSEKILDAVERVVLKHNENFNKTEMKKCNKCTGYYYDGELIQN